MTLPESTRAAYRRPAGPERFVDRFLEDVTLPRVIVRAAECVLLSGIEMRRPVLDVGCGDGTFAAALFDEPVDAGIDPWRKQLRYAHALRAYRGVFQASGEALPFPDASFQTVFSNSTLEHTERPWAILKEMARVARPGATCIVTVPSPYFTQFLLGSTALRTLRLQRAARLYGDFMNHVSRHRHVRPREEWLHWLQAAGLRAIETRYYFSRLNTMVLDVGHYISAPSILTRAMLGRWVLWPGKKRFLPYRQLLSRFASPGDDEEKGAYMLFHCVKDGI